MTQARTERDIFDAEGDRHLNINARLLQLFRGKDYWKRKPLMDVVNHLVKGNLLKIEAPGGIEGLQNSLFAGHVDGKQRDWR